MTVETIESGISAVVAAIPKIIAAAAILMAVLPQGTPGSTWDKIRSVVNYVAMNWGSAKNVVQK